MKSGTGTGQPVYALYGDIVHSIERMLCPVLLSLLILKLLTNNSTETSYVYSEPHIFKCPANNIDSVITLLFKKNHDSEVRKLV